MYFILVSVYYFHHKLTLALIWIAEKQTKNMTLPLYGVIMFFIFTVSIILFVPRFPKSNHLGFYCGWKSWGLHIRLSQHELCMGLYMCVSVYVCVCVCVCFKRASINSVFFLVCLLFCHVTHQITEPQSWIMKILNLENQIKR